MKVVWPKMGQNGYIFGCVIKIESLITADILTLTAEIDESKGSAKR